MKKSLKNAARSFAVLGVIGFMLTATVIASEMETTPEQTMIPETTVEAIPEQTTIPVTPEETTPEQTTIPTTPEETTPEQTTILTTPEETTTKPQNFPIVKNGFYKEKGKTRYYIDGKRYKGVLKLKGKIYYFNANGNMVTGSCKINGKYYYSESNGVMKLKKGFYKEKGKTRYYKKGKLHKGFLKYKNNKYYFNKKGNMVTGNYKIKKAYYYFGKKGVMKKGFVKIKSKKYYYSKKTGKKLFGFRKIGGYNYYLNEDTGAVTTGFVTREYNDSVIRTYYDKAGRLKTGTFKVSTVLYKADEESGAIYYVNNIVDVICQRPELPTGCEITSWTMMANYAGVEISKFKAANVMPRSWDPNRGFVGSPYNTYGGSLVVYPDGLRSMTIKYLGSHVNMTGCSFETIKEKLRNKHLVMVWVTRLDGFNSHTVSLTGYDESGFYYNDPWTGTKRLISYDYFRTIWSENSYRAMSY